MAPRRRVRQQSNASIHIWIRNGIEFPWQLAGHIHGTILHKSSEARLGTSVRVHMVWIQYDRRRFHMVLPTGDAGPNP